MVLDMIELSKEGRKKKLKSILDNMPTADNKTRDEIWTGVFTYDRHQENELQISKITSGSALN